MYAWLRLLVRFTLGFTLLAYGFAKVYPRLESLGDDEVCRGRLHKAGENGYTRKSFDITAAFLDVLGKPVSEVPDNCERSELLVDTAMDLETSASKV